MKRALLVPGLVLGLAACVRPAAGPSARAHRPPVTAPGVVEEPPVAGVDPFAFPALLGWQPTGEVKLSVKGPIAFAPWPGDRLLAALVSRAAWDGVEVAVVFARQGTGGQPSLVAFRSLGTAPSTGWDPRDSSVILSRAPLGGGAEAIRADLGVWQDRPPHRFAIRASFVTVDEAGQARLLLERVVEDGDDSLDRRAVLHLVDVDGDGRNELVADEPGVRVVYTLTPQGFVTRTPSRF